MGIVFKLLATQKDFDTLNLLIQNDGVFGRCYTDDLKATLQEVAEHVQIAERLQKVIAAREACCVLV